MRQAHVQLAAWRQRSGLTLTAAAELLNTKWWNLRRYESGERLPSLECAVEIERVVRIPVEAWAKRKAA